MKRLWTVIPPTLSDLMGFQAVMNATKGLGIIDDPSNYKLRGIAGRADRDNHHGAHGEHGSHSHHKEHGEHGHHRGHGEYNGSGRHGGRRGLDTGNRVLSSNIRNEDIINGTESKVLETAESGYESMNPDFVLLAYGPSDSMIGSDLEGSAEQIQHKYNIPSSMVNIYGEKDYLYGISKTLEAMGKLLLQKQERRERTLNIIGVNPIDWDAEECKNLRIILENANWTIVSVWGMQEETASLRAACSAGVNLVVSQSGLRLAEYMRTEYGIPYVAGAPFGEWNVQQLLDKLEKYAIPNGQYEAVSMEKANQRDSTCDDTDPEILIIGEQFRANAIRSMLYAEDTEMKVRVMSFSEMDKAWQHKGDLKISDESMLADQLNQSSVRMVIANPDYKPLLKNDVQWIDLPSAGFSPVESVGHIPMVGSALDQWLVHEEAVD